MKNKVLTEHLSKIIFIILLFALYVSTVAVRFDQFADYWVGDQENFTYQGIPMVTTVDAYTWLRMAQLYDSGYTEIYDEKSYFPDYQHSPELKPKFLLPVLISKLSVFTGGNMYKAGFFLVAFTAGLFVIPLGIYLFKAGYPVAGIMGGFAGSYCTVYMIRSNIGRIDTDCLNLFFVYATALSLLLFSKAKSRFTLFLYSAIFGIFQLLFYYWYRNPALLLINIFAMVLLCIINKINGEKLFSWGNIVAVVIIATVFSGPLIFINGMNSLLPYVYSLIGYKPESKLIASFPAVYSTISEITKKDLIYIVNNSFINSFVFLFSVAGLIIFSLKNFRNAIPLILSLILASYAFLVSIRGLMYLMPLLGIGFGYMLTFLITIIKRLNDTMRVFLPYVACIIIIVVFIFMPTHNGLTYTQKIRPSLYPYEFSTFVKLHNLPEDSAVYTWWDYGQVINAVSSRASFHSGTIQSTLKTWLIAKSFILTSSKLANVVSFITDNGVDGIKNVFSDNITVAEAEEYLYNYSEPLSRDNVYILFTRDMIDKFPAIGYIGNWDLVKAKDGEKQFFVNTDACSGTKGNKDKCGQVFIDIDLGMINGYIPLKSIDVVDVRNGHVIRDIQTGYISDYSVILVKNGADGENLWMYLMENDTYNTSFIQMFLLGRYDSSRFKEIDTNYPLSRIYEVVR